MFTLALPGSGRLAEPVCDMMKQVGLDLQRPDRVLQRLYPEFDLRVVFIRPKDAAKLVEAGYVDLAISADDILAETSAKVSIVQKLGSGKCRVVLAVREDSPFQTASDLAGYRLATAHPNLTRKWCDQQEVEVAAIIPFHGALEIMPWLGCCEGIVDSYQTGQSAHTNGLRPIATLMESEAVLIGHSEILTNSFPEPITTLLTKLAQSGKAYL